MNRRNSIKTWSFALISIILSIATFFMVSELLIRLIKTDTIHKHIYDNLLGHKRVPGSKGIYKQDEFYNEVKYNKWGYHDVEHDLIKPENVFRIVVLGDSMVEGIEVPLKENMTYKLSQLLNNNSPDSIKYEVINMGVSAYGTTNEYLLLKSIGLKFKPDLVILCLFTYNDIRNNSIFLEQATYDWQKAIQPYFELKDDSAVLHLPNQQASWKYWIFNNLRFIQFLHERVSKIKFLAKWMVKLGLLYKSTYLRIHGIPIDYQIYSPKHNQSKEWEKGWQTTEYLLKETKSLLLLQGIPFVVMVLTNQEQVYKEYWHKILETHPEMKAERWDLELPEIRINNILDRLEIDHLNLLPYFRKSAQDYPKRRLHYLIDSHWTAEGHTTASQSLYEFIRTRYLNNGIGK